MGQCSAVFKDHLRALCVHLEAFHILGLTTAKVIFTMKRIVLLAVTVHLLAICWTSPLKLVKRQAEGEEASDDVPVPEPAPARASPVARPPPSSSSSAFTYKLADAAELIVGSIKSTFSCDNRIYGYYADTDNDCKIFHVCVPVPKEGGAPETFMYSFFCGNLTVFDQNSLTCVHQEDGPVCAEAPSLYDTVNSRFGITDRPGGSPPARAPQPAASAPEPVIQPENEGAS